jgi:hypothetical protein
MCVESPPGSIGFHGFLLDPQVTRTLIRSSYAILSGDGEVYLGRLCGANKSVRVYEGALSWSLFISIVLSSMILQAAGHVHALTCFHTASVIADSCMRI